MRASLLLRAALGAAPVVSKAVPNTLPDGPVPAPMRWPEKPVASAPA
ncbi:hypothetical protein LL974_21335 [Xanthomonas campestris pv. cannae]|nr:hypothetical protein [Xanthomonas campestris pv. cannae]